MDAPGLAALDLPVAAVVDDLRAALRDPGVAVLVAEPGAGKTTGVPIWLLDEEWMGDGRLVVLEPRRVAARAAARRMAELLGEPVGGTIGYRTRDDSKVGPGTRIEVVTDGVLVRRLQADPSLPGVRGVMLDEFHERSLVGDLALAFALDARAALRPDLRLLVASATLDHDRVADLLGTAGGAGGPAPVVASRGRLHPVDVTWAPTERADREAATVREARRAVAGGAAGVLAFLPGVREIERARRDLDGVDAEVLALHGSLGREEQDRALRPPSRGQVKVVLSTDLAETSVTVEGIDVVVDSGLARRPRFDPRTGMSRLETVTVSRASADQRAGRAGRTGPGSVVRLWSEGEHARRPAHSPPELEEVDLASLVLECLAWGTGDPSSLPFLDQPPAAAWQEGRSLLEALGAVDDRGLTAAGRSMADLPLHPRLARMVVGAVDHDVAATGCVVAALLEERDVLSGRPGEVPVDLGLRAAIVGGRRSHDRASRARVDRARRRAGDIARRAGVPRPSGDAVDVDDVGRCLLWAYPDRVARARPGRRGHFLTRAGTGVALPEHDVLSGEEWLVVADVDGRRRPADVRQAAGASEAVVLDELGAAVEETVSVEWDPGRGDLVAREATRLGAITLSEHVHPPDPGPEVVAHLVARVRERGLGELSWSARAQGLRRRVGHLRATEEGSGRWPDLSDGALLDSLEEWLAPLLMAARGRSDLRSVDTWSALVGLVGHRDVTDVDRLAPSHLDLPSGRRAPIDYEDGPRVVARVQEVYGLAETPRIGPRREPVTFDLRSPADRPVQITADLAGFWAGTWAEVRREMAGRYPKHDWPEDPRVAVAHRGSPRRRSR